MNFELFITGTDATYAGRSAKIAVSNREHRAALAASTHRDSWLQVEYNRRGGTGPLCRLIER